MLRLFYTRILMAAAVAAATATIGCGGAGTAPPGGQPPTPPPTGVKTITLETKPIDRTSDLIATIHSLHATTIQPDVEGAVTRIFVKSGDRVKTGAPLVQIDPDRQQAAARTTEASRSGTEADVQYWRQQVKRLE